MVVKITSIFIKCSIKSPIMIFCTLSFYNSRLSFNQAPNTLIF
jgi:hypothetical protein